MFKKCLLLAAVVTAFPVAAKDIKSIGVSVGDLGNPFFMAIVKGVTDKARELGGKDVKIISGDMQWDLNKQFIQLDNFKAAGVDMIIVNAADPVAIEPAMKRLREGGIVTVAVDVAAKGADATVTTNNVQAGEISCKYITDKLSGKGNIVILTAQPTSAVLDRVDGCKKVLAKTPGMKILSDNQNAKGSRDGGMEVMTSLLTANPKIDAVFAINDPEAIGADLAARQQGRKGIIMTSVDGAPDVEVALKEAGSQVEASASQNPYNMAAKAVEIGFAIAKGNPPANPVTLIPSELVTRQNVASYKGWTAR